MYVPYSDKKHWYNDIGFNEIELWIDPYKFHQFSYNIRLIQWG